LRRCFGSIYDANISLFAAITGGNDWMYYAELLRMIPGVEGEIYFISFAFYIGFCLVGMLNVVTGIFVDSAVCTRTEDEVVESYSEDQKRISEEVRRIFHEADVDNSGTLSIDELRAQLHNPWVKAYFSGLEIDCTDANIIFTLIDTDGTQRISIDEFVSGTMKLKGHARSIDVLSLMFDSVRFSVKFNMLCAYIEEQLLDMQQHINPNYEVQPKVFKSMKECMHNVERFRQ
jgi:hypothetical protein